jgi:hypothetical protein
MPAGSERGGPDDGRRDGRRDGDRVGEPAVESTDLPVTFRPRGVRIAAYVFGGLLLATVVVLWVSFPQDVRDSFTTFQRLTVLVLGLLVLAIEHGLTRCRIDATEDGLRVVNGYRTHHYGWAEVVAVTLRTGNPWAVLDLSDGTSQGAMGIQGSDGPRAKAQVRRLRALVEAHAADEPPRPGPA